MHAPEPLMSSPPPADDTLALGNPLTSGNPGSAPVSPAGDIDPASRMNALQQDLLRKAEMEAALIAAPQDTRIRAAYFEEIIRFASVRTGLTHVILPELGQPLSLRCGTADVLGLVRVFRDTMYDIPMRATPQRIVILGAYIGFAAVFLAHRFPTAHILCVEPNQASYRVLCMNTLPYRRIHALNLAAWHSNSALGIQARYLGDWGLHLGDQLPDTERTIPARSMAEILRLASWDRVDFLLCDILGGERAVFADPGQRWLQTLDTLFVQQHDAAAPGASEQVSACFDPNDYSVATQGEVQVYERHVPFRALRQPAAPEMPLINSEPGLFPVALQDTSAANWSFFIFDGDCCQLHPGGPGERPARAIFPRTLDGHTRFTTVLRHAGRQAASVVFRVLISNEEGGEVFRAEHTVVTSEQHEFGLDFPALHGRHHIILETEMIPGAPHNYNAWAQFLSPRIA